MLGNLPKKFIVGVTGTLASGKDTVAEFICEKYNLKNYSTSDEARLETGKRGLEQVRENWQVVANDMRATFGPGELAKRTAARIGEDMSVVTGIRNLGEIDYLKENSYFYLISVDAPIETRYERAVRRGRGKEEQRTFAEFKAAEDAEVAGGVNGQQLVACMSRGDFFIVNDSTLENLNIRTEEIMNAILLQFNETIKAAQVKVAAVEEGK